MRHCLVPERLWRPTAVGQAAHDPASAKRQRDDKSRLCRRSRACQAGFGGRGKAFVGGSLVYRPIDARHHRILDQRRGAAGQQHKRRRQHRAAQRKPSPSAIAGLALSHATRSLAVLHGWTCLSDIHSLIVFGGGGGSVVNIDLNMLGFWSLVTLDAGTLFAPREGDFWGVNRFLVPLTKRLVLSLIRVATDGDFEVDVPATFTVGTCFELVLNGQIQHPSPASALVAVSKKYAKPKSAYLAYRTVRTPRDHRDGIAAPVELSRCLRREQ